MECSTLDGHQQPLKVDVGVQADGPEAAVLQGPQAALGPATALNGSYLPPAELGRLLGAGTCSICFEPLQGRAVTVTLCGHVFHRSCLNTAGSPRCPQCRQPVDDKAVQEASPGHGSEEELPASMPVDVLLVQEVYEWQPVRQAEWVAVGPGGPPWHGAVRHSRPLPAVLGPLPQLPHSLVEAGAGLPSNIWEVLAAMLQASPGRVGPGATTSSTPVSYSRTLAPPPQVLRFRGGPAASGPQR